jgi:hypothetical protein
LHPEAKVSFAKVDLSSLASVKEFAETINAKNEPVDILMNNAGIGGTPRRITTVDGFESQLFPIRDKSFVSSCPYGIAVVKFEEEFCAEGGQSFRAFSSQGKD